MRLELLLLLLHRPHPRLVDICRRGVKIRRADTHSEMYPLQYKKKEGLKVINEIEVAVEVVEGMEG